MGTSAPTGAKMIAASSAIGGSSVEAPAHTAPRDRANLCAALWPGDVKASTSRPSCAATWKDREGGGGQLTVHDVQVCATNAARTDTDEDFVDANMRCGEIDGVEARHAGSRNAIAFIGCADRVGARGQ